MHLYFNWDRENSILKGSLRMNKKGFIMIETLVGFLVFSLILAMYLPGLYQITSKIQEAELKTQRLAEFSQVVGMILSDANQKSVENYLSDEVQLFGCDQQSCWISYKDGDSYEVVRQS